jgi:hypothetical protein
MIHNNTVAVRGGELAVSIILNHCVPKNAQLQDACSQLDRGETLLEGWVLLVLDSMLMQSHEA